MIDEREEILTDGTSIGKEPSDLHTALSYLRSFARYPDDKPSELMKSDAQWLRATQRLYKRLSDSDRQIVDSYASDEFLSGKTLKSREKRLKYLATLLLVEAGKQSPFAILLPYGDDEHGKDQKKTDCEANSLQSDVRI